MRTYSLDDFPPQLAYGVGQTMTLDPTRLLLATKAPTSLDQVEALIAPYELTTEDAEDRQERRSDLPLRAVVNYTDERFWVRRRGDRPLTPELFAEMQEGLAAMLDWLGPVYRVGDRPGRHWLLCPLPHVLLLKKVENPAPEQDQAFEELMSGLGATESPEDSAYLGGWRYYVLGDQSQLAYALRDGLLLQPQLVANVELDTMPMLLPLAAIPNDQYYNDHQWCMKQIKAGSDAGNPNAPAVTGWDKWTGDPGEIICIFDTGCDLTHPDLSFATGYNSTTKKESGAPVEPQEEPGMAGHGTCCAGVAAARYNNNAGVAGVAGGCRVMPVTCKKWEDSEIVRGIGWAAKHGASVISMSFGDLRGPRAVIDNAIDQAAYLYDCVLVAATGNTDSSGPRPNQIIYPASHPLVIAVGGSDRDDKRKTILSSDGEDWEAMYGAGISVVAPCVGIATTDICGNGADAGFNTNRGGPKTVAGVAHNYCGDPNGDYFFWFNGTSAATPMVAGLAAVIRSYYRRRTGRKLRSVQVRDIIEQTADKVPNPAIYTSQRPNGTWSNEMGYGRVNMVRALQEVENRSPFPLAMWLSDWLRRLFDWDRFRNLPHLSP